MLAYKGLTELDGYMARCILMLEVFDDVKGGKYKKQFIKASDAFAIGQGPEKEETEPDEREAPLEVRVFS